jgi:hydroxypyruvate isomerase
MARFAANLSMMFTELTFLDRFAAAAAAGFKGVEFLFPYEHPAHEIRRRLDDNGLTLALFNLPPGDWAKGERGLTALRGREEEFARGLDLALGYAAALGCGRLHAMAGLETHGADRATYVANLAGAAERARLSGIDILIEPINTFDMPSYFLTRTREAAAVIAESGASNLGLQLDLYHRQRMEGGVADAVAAYAPITRHYQIAGLLDRGEPWPSELDYAPLLAQIAAAGFDGWIGCESRPRAGTAAGLGWLAKLGPAIA